MFLILVFIFILAAFNLVASLNMLFIEKKEDIKTLSELGATDSFIFQIFFFEGILIALKGIVGGLLLGIAICFLQMKYQLLDMPNTINEGFPIILETSDIVFVILTVCSLGVVMSYLPVRYLVHKARK